MILTSLLLGLLIFESFGLKFKSFLYTIGGTGSDFGNGLVSTSDGGFVMIGSDDGQGSSSDFLISKFNSDGEMEWFDLVSAGSETDTFRSVIVNEAGEYFVAGESTNSGTRDCIISKYDKYGNNAWIKQFGSPNNYEGCREMVLGDNGEIITQFNSDMFVGGTGVILFALDPSNGDVLWAKKLAKNGHWMGTLTGTRGDYRAIGGEFYSGFITKVENIYQNVVSKWNTSGSLIWIHSYGNNVSDDFESMISTKDGGIVGVGRTKFCCSPSYDTYIFRLNSTGHPQWVREFGGYNFDAPMDVFADEYQTVYVTGREDQVSGRDCYITRINYTTSEILWNKILDTGSSDECKSIARLILKDNEAAETSSFVVTGYTDIGIDRDIFLYKFEEHGDGGNITGCSEGSNNFVVKDWEAQDYHYIDRWKEWTFVDHTGTSDFTLTDVALTGTDVQRNRTDDQMNPFDPSGGHYKRRCQICEDDYFGDVCNVTTCFSTLNNVTNEVCSGHGKCFPMDVCECNDNFFGKDCSVSYDCSEDGDFVIGSFCYHFFVNASASWNESLHRCRNDWLGGRGDLISIQSSEEDDAIRNKMSSLDLGVIWIGLYKNETTSDKLRCREFLKWSDEVDLAYAKEKSVVNCTALQSTCFAMERSGRWTDYYFCNSTTFYDPSMSSAPPQTSYGCKIEIPRCYGYLASYSDKSLICSGNGYCIGNNRCFCKDGFYGEFCNVTMCHGIFSNATTGGLVCNGHGNCIGGQDSRCNCSFGYNGTKCDEWSCFHTERESEESCGAHGTCIARDKCQCATESYSGHQCQFWSCFNVSVQEVDVVCGTHGACVSSDFCLCNSGYSSSSETSPCDLFFCGEYGKDDARSCNKRGKCVKSHECRCDEEDKYSGNLCQTWKCYSIDKEDRLVACSGNGDCTSPNECECHDGYTGKKCQTNALLIGVLTPVLSIACIFGFLLIACVVGVICVLILLVFALVVLVSLLLLGILSSVVIKQRKGMKRFSQLKNFDMLLKEQEMEEDSTVAHLRMKKDLYQIPFEEIKVDKILGEGISKRRF